MKTLIVGLLTLLLNVPAYAGHVGEELCPGGTYPGVTETFDRIPPGQAKKLTDDLDRGRSSQAAMKQALRPHRDKRIKMWRQDPKTSLEPGGVAPPSLRRQALDIAGSLYSPCIEQSFNAVGKLQSAMINVGDKLRQYHEFCVGGDGCPGGRFRVNTTQEDVPTGDNIRVRGASVLAHDVLACDGCIIRDGEVAAAVQPTYPPNAHTTGNIRVMVVPAHIDGGIDPVPWDIQDKTNKMVALADEDGEGLFKIVPTIMPMVDLGIQTDCNPPTMSRIARNQLQWVDQSGDVLLLVGDFAKAGCGRWTGLAYLNAQNDVTGNTDLPLRYAYVVNGASACTWLHEFYHTWSWGHAGGLWHCIGKIPYDDPLVECTNVEYAGREVIGTTGANGCMTPSTWYKQHSGLAPNQMIKVTAPTTVTLRSQSGPGFLPRAACFDRGRTEDMICVQHRKKFGRDQYISSPGTKFSGAELKMRAISSNWLRIVEIRGETANSTDHQNTSNYNLPIGQEIQDPRTGIIIRPESETTETLTVSFRQGSPQTSTTTSTSTSTTLPGQIVMVITGPSNVIINQPAYYTAELRKDGVPIPAVGWYWQASPSGSTCSSSGPCPFTWTTGIGTARLTAYARPYDWSQSFVSARMDIFPKASSTTSTQPSSTTSTSSTTSSSTSTIRTTTSTSTSSTSTTICLAGGTKPLPWECSRCCSRRCDGLGFCRLPAGQCKLPRQRCTLDRDWECCRKTCGNNGKCKP